MNYVEILLVEDNSNDAELTFRALQKNNVTNHIYHVRDGAEALDFLFNKGQYSGRADQKKPKLILLDLKMPKIDGLEVLKVIKADNETKQIPVVVLTSSNEEKDLIESYKYGVNSYIVKPLEFNKFVQAVADVGLYWMILNQTPPKKNND